MFKRLVTKLLHKASPETAHQLTLSGLKYIPPFFLTGKERPNPRLSVSLFGLDFPTPVGLAAGFDKDGEIWQQMLALGFGHVEVGTVTPMPQRGNPTPRVFRLEEDRAVINRMGFPSKGQAAVLANVKKHHQSDGIGILGLNIGRNKNQKNAETDYIAGVQTFATCADYLTINISSPNTPGLRDLQGKKALESLLHAILMTRESLRPGLPLLLKVAPDLDDAAISDITDVVINTRVSGNGINGLIISNTTIARPDTLRNRNKEQTGGLSGAPLRAGSTEILRKFYKETGGALPLIGVGGISTAADAWEKIISGASLVQLYTSMIYTGPEVTRNITEGLLHIINKEGLSSIQDAVGKDV